MKIKLTINSQLKSMMTLMSLTKKWKMSPMIKWSQIGTSNLIRIIFALGKPQLLQNHYPRKRFFPSPNSPILKSIFDYFQNDLSCQMKFSKVEINYSAIYCASKTMYMLLHYSNLKTLCNQVYLLKKG